MKRVTDTRKGTRIIRASGSVNFDYNIGLVLNEWRRVKFCGENEKVEDWMPNEMPDIPFILDKTRKLQTEVANQITNLKVKQSFISEHLSTISSLRGTRARGGIKLTMSDIMEGVPSFQIIFEENEFVSNLAIRPLISTKTEKSPNRLQVTLRQSDTILLYEHNSETVSIWSPEAESVAYDNKVYDYLTTGEGQYRRRKQAEAQTKRKSCFSTAIGTDHKKKVDSEGFASSYDIYDTMQAVNNQTRKNTEPKFQPKNRHTYLDALSKSAAFTYATMCVERSIANNIYGKEQLQYRNLLKPTVCGFKSLSYDVKEIFRFANPMHKAFTMGITSITSKKTKERKAVVDISICFGNADLIAVAYGICTHIQGYAQTRTGNVCVWSIKNMLQPERSYAYKTPVTAISFSPFDHSLLAIGTHNGWLEVRDISVDNKPPLAIINKSLIINNSPIIAIKWQEKCSTAYVEHKQLLTLSLDAVVCKFRFTNSAYLSGSELMRLTRVSGAIEGLPFDEELLADNFSSQRHLLGLNLTLDPLNEDYFYVLSSQGCVHNCSMTLQGSHLSVFRSHLYGSVNCMEFSPWSPKVFLTCGNDWHVRIWMFGITEPLLELTNKMKPVYCAAWSPTQSTTIFSLNIKTLDIWDIRIPFKPIKSVYVAKSYNTLFKISPSGSTIMIGNEHGDVIFCSLDETFFFSKFQYNTLENALYNAVTNEKVRQKIQSVGFFGYKKKSNRRMFSKVYVRI